MNIQFSATTDTNSKIITWLTIGAGSIFLIAEWFVLRTREFFIYVPAIIILTTVLGTCLYAPMGYSFLGDKLVVHRRIKPYLISLADITSMQYISPEQMGRAWRAAGNGGLFGYTGWYNSSKVGRMRWFATRKSNYVLITLRDQRLLVVTPDDVRRMLDAYHQISL
jgi:hypothetical protein